jgi:hypothetical protein
MYHNIDCRTFHRGEYVGHPGPWRVWRSNGPRGPWTAIHRTDPAAPIITRSTLREISVALEQYATASH